MGMYTNPPEKCNLCGCEIKKLFYDFTVPRVGSWANGCHSCFRAYRGRLGVGLGQKYRKEKDGNFWKEGTFPQPTVKERRLAEWNEHVEANPHLKDDSAGRTCRPRPRTLLRLQMNFDLTGVDKTNSDDRMKMKLLGLTEEEIDTIPPYEPEPDGPEDD